jgi:hypothetical protein
MMNLVEKIMKLVPQKCPRCEHLSMLVLSGLEIPVRVRIFFLITFTAVLQIEYCPNCGRLKISQNK